MVRTSLLDHEFRGEDKKRPSMQNLSLGIHSSFLSLGGTSSILAGAQISKCAPVASGLLLSFGAKSSLGGHNFCLGGGAQAVIWGARPRNAPPWHRACGGPLLGWKTFFVLYVWQKSAVKVPQVPGLGAPRNVNPSYII